MEERKEKMAAKPKSMDVLPAVPFPVSPPLFFPLIYIEFYIQEIVQKDKGNGNWADLAEKRVKTIHNNFIQLYSDGQKEPMSACAGFAFVIPRLNVILKERTSVH